MGPEPQPPHPRARQRLLLALVAAALPQGQMTVPNTPPRQALKTDDGAGFMSAPFYADPLFDAAHDAEFVWHAGEQTWCEPGRWGTPSVNTPSSVITIADILLLDCL